MWSFKRGTGTDILFTKNFNIGKSYRLLWSNREFEGPLIRDWVRVAIVAYDEDAPGSRKHLGFFDRAVCPLETFWHC